MTAQANYQIVATTANQKWEYKLVFLPDPALMKGQDPSPVLNPIGTEGWELVSVTMAEIMHNRFYNLWFKRPVSTP